MLPPLDAKKNSVCSIFAAASFFPGSPASSCLRRAGAGSGAGQWGAPGGTPPRVPTQGESGWWSAPFGPPREFVSSGRGELLNQKLERDIRSCSPLGARARLRHAGVLGAFSLGHHQHTHTHPARSQQREKGPNLAKSSHVLLALQAQDLFATQGHPERGGNAGSGGSGGRSATCRQGSVDASSP